VIFKDLIKSHSWLSIEITLLNLYPAQEEIFDDYKTVFESLQVLEPENSEILIVLIEYECDSSEGNEPESTYVDVSGRKPFPETNSISDSYAIEFVKWEKWLGMGLAPETLDNFNELEIIAHCLFEMTFCGYQQEEIQEQFDSINKSIEEYKSLTEEEKEKQTISLEELKKKLDDKGGRRKDGK
jgi:hypothetical protein